MRKPLSVEEKLVYTFRFLATSESYSSFQYQFRTSKGTIPLFTPKVCSAIYIALRGIYLSFPKTEEWLKISNDIYMYWQFPNVIGALDRKYIFNVPGEGSLFYKTFWPWSNIITNIRMSTLDAREG